MKLELMCETERLRIFCMCGVRITAHNKPRDVYVAFRKDEDWPMVAATAVIMPDLNGRPFIDWLEVAAKQRRQGLGTELYWALAEYAGVQLEDQTGGTPAGERFLEKLEAAANE